GSRFSTSKGPPGASRIMKKAMAISTSSVGTASSRRRSVKRSIGTSVLQEVQVTAGDAVHEVVLIAADPGLHEALADVEVQRNERHVVHDQPFRLRKQPEAGDRVRFAARPIEEFI